MGYGIAAELMTNGLMNTPRLKSSDATQYYQFAESAIAATRTITMPLLTSNANFVFDSFLNVFTVTQTFNGLITGTLGLTVTGAAVNLNASSNFATNINTGTSTGAVSIGNAAMIGNLTLTTGGNIALNAAVGSIQISATAVTGVTVGTGWSLGGATIAGAGTFSGALTTNAVFTVTAGGINVTGGIGNGAAPTANQLTLWQVLSGAALASSLTIAGQVTGGIPLQRDIVLQTGNAANPQVLATRVTIGSNAAEAAVTWANTNHVGLKLGGAVTGNTQDVSNLNSVSFGAIPATIGSARLPNAGAVYSRNAGNTTDILMISVDASNQLLLADGNTVRTVIQAGGLTIAGNFTLGIGSNSNVNNALQIDMTMGAGATSQFGVRAIPTFSSGATVLGAAIYASLITPAAVFTMTSGYGLLVDTQTRGAGSVITSQYGIRINAQTGGSTNNYGLYVDTPSGGTNNYTAIFAGAGNVGIGVTAPTSVLHLGGPYALPIANKTAAYIIVASDSVITADATTAAFNVTLPTAVGITGRVYTVKRTNAGANNVTVLPNGVQTIDGAASVVLNAQNMALTVISDGANWQVIHQVATTIL